MITGVKIIQYHLTKLEDAEKELAEVLWTFRREG